MRARLVRIVVAVVAVSLLSAVWAQAAGEETVVIPASGSGATASSILQTGTMLTISGEYTFPLSNTSADAFYAVPSSPQQAPGKLDALRAKSVFPGSTTQGALSAFLQSYPAYQPSHVYHVVEGSELGSTTLSCQICIPGQASGQLTIVITGPGAKGGGSMPPITEQVPSPSSFSQTVTAPEPVPGGTALTTSPLLGGLGVLGAPVSVDVGGLTDADVALINSFRHQCYVDAAHELLQNIQQYATNDFSKVQKDFEQAFPLYYFQANTEIAECLAFVNAVVAGGAGLARNPAPSAAATQASCPLTGVKLGVSGSGAHLHLRSVRFVRADDESLLLKVGCTRRAGGRSFTVSTRSKHRPLSAVVGSRLRITVVRSRHDASGGRLSFAFGHA